MTSQAKPTQTLEEMAREALSNIDPHPDADCDCFSCEDGRKQIKAAMTRYANQRLREAAGKIKEQGSRVGLPTGAAADLVTAMIEGEP